MNKFDFKESIAWMILFGIIFLCCAIFTSAVWGAARGSGQSTTRAIGPTSDQLYLIIAREEPGWLTASTDSINANFIIISSAIFNLENLSGNTNYVRITRSSLGLVSTDFVTVNAASFTFVNQSTININAGTLSFDAGTLFIDALNNRIGISTTNPPSILTLQGPASEVNQIRIISVTGQELLRFGAAGSAGSAERGFYRASDNGVVVAQIAVNTSDGLTFFNGPPVSVANNFTSSGSVQLGDAAADVVSVVAASTTFINASTVSLNGTLSFDEGTLFIHPITNRVAISCTGPVSLLTVHGGDMTSSPLVVIGSNPTNGITARFENLASNGFAGLAFRSNGGITTGNIAWGNPNTTAFNNVLSLGTPGGDPLVLVTNNVERMRIAGIGDISIAPSSFTFLNQSTVSFNNSASRIIMASSATICHQMMLLPDGYTEALVSSTPLTVPVNFTTVTISYLSGTNAKMALLDTLCVYTDDATANTRNLILQISPLGSALNSRGCVNETTSLFRSKSVDSKSDWFQLNTSRQFMFRCLPDAIESEQTCQMRLRGWCE